MIATAELGVGLDDIKHAGDLERHLLACCLRDGQEDAGAVDEAAALIAVADFAHYAHGVVFGAMLALRASGTPVTPATVYEQLRAAHALADLGGDAAAGWLVDVYELQPTGALADYFAGKVRDASRLRALKRAAAEVAATLERGRGEVADLAAQCEQLIFGASGVVATNGGPRSVGDVVRAELRAIDDRAAGGPPGLQTGFREADALLCGMRPGQLFVIGARPSVGKSSLALGIAANVAAAGTGVLFCSLEMRNDEMAQRLLAIRTGVRLTNIREGRLTSEHAGRLVAAEAAVSRWPLHFEDTPNLTADRLAALARRAVRRNGIGLLVVDYLQLMEPENPRDTKNAQIGLLARRLKLIARECDIPVIVPAQLNRGSENRADARPRLSDLRDSGEIEQHADIVALLWEQPNQTTDPRPLIDCDLAKNRNGPKGVASLRYTRALTRFEDAI